MNDKTEQLKSAILKSKFLLADVSNILGKSLTFTAVFHGTKIEITATDVKLKVQQHTDALGTSTLFSADERNCFNGLLSSDLLEFVLHVIASNLKEHYASVLNRRMILVAKTLDAINNLP
jgi:hypothetical protein